MENKDFVYYDGVNSRFPLMNTKLYIAKRILFPILFLTIFTLLEFSTGFRGRGKIVTPTAFDYFGIHPILSIVCGIISAVAIIFLIKNWGKPICGELIITSKGFEIIKRNKLITHNFSDIYSMDLNIATANKYIYWGQLYIYSIIRIKYRHCGKSKRLEIVFKSEDSEKSFRKRINRKIEKRRRTS